MLRNLKALREESGVSQKQLADVVMVSQQSINKYENHNIEPDIDTMAKIADFFNTSIDYLVGHSDVRRKIERVQEYALNEGEAQLIDSYRKLSASQRESIHLVIQNYINR